MKFSTNFETKKAVMDRNDIAVMRSIHTKCARVRMDLSDNVESLRRSIPAVTNEHSEGTRQQLEPTFHMVKDNLLDMQSIIDLWSPCHSFYYQFAHVVVPMVINDIDTLYYTSPLTVEGMHYLICSLEALIECYDDCCHIIFNPFPIPSVWEWSAAPFIFIFSPYVVSLLLVVIFKVLAKRIICSRFCLLTRINSFLIKMCFILPSQDEPNTTTTTTAR